MIDDLQEAFHEDWESIPSGRERPRRDQCRERGGERMAGIGNGRRDRWKTGGEIVETVDGRGKTKIKRGVYSAKNVGAARWRRGGTATDTFPADGTTLEVLMGKCGEGGSEEEVLKTSGRLGVGKMGRLGETGQVTMGPINDTILHFSSERQVG